jgi:hypothetical protein
MAAIHSNGGNSAGIFLASILLKEMRYLVYIRYICEEPVEEPSSNVIYTRNMNAQVVTGLQTSWLQICIHAQAVDKLCSHALLVPSYCNTLDGVL